MAAFRWVTSSDPKVVVGAPFRTIVDHGIQVGIHGDGVHIAPLNPWPHIYFATTGVNSFGDKVNGDQQLTRQEALRLFTRGNSWFLRMEDKIGSIEPGKLADLAVLDRDYFAVPDAEIKQIRSVLTIVDGKIVHDSKVVWLHGIGHAPNATSPLPADGLRADECHDARRNPLLYRLVYRPQVHRARDRFAPAECWYPEGAWTVVRRSRCSGPAAGVIISDVWSVMRR